MNSSESPVTEEGDDGIDIVAELTSLHDRAIRTAAELKKKGAELAALMSIPSSEVVVAAFDDRGLLTSLVIDAEAKAKLDGPGLVREINIALANAERKPAQAPAKDSLTPEAAAGLIESIFSGLTSGLSSEPLVYRNDLATVSVTTMWGEVLSVECAGSWITASSTDSISDEVIRVANLAARADDPLKRRKD